MLSDEDMRKFGQKYSEWWSNRTIDEYELHGKILEYEESYFEDMTFQPNSELYNREYPKVCVNLQTDVR